MKMFNNKKRIKSTNNNKQPMAGPTTNSQPTTNNHQQLLVSRCKLLVASRQSFTLIELLVAVALIAVLSVAVIMSLNPQELIKQSRDSTRLSDLQNLNKSLSWFEADTGGTGFMGSSSVIYVSIPDTTSTCANLGLPTPPSGYSYRCVTAQNLQKTDGSGWIPVNFNQISFGKTLTKLPIDPINQTSTGNYYTYVAGGSWKLTTRFESQKYTLQHVAQDGGPDPALYELGTDLNLVPFVGGMVGYWSFDEGSGTTVYDRSGYGNNGVIYFGSNPTDLHVNNCKINSCMDTGVGNETKRLLISNNLGSYSELSIIFWFYKRSTSGIWGYLWDARANGGAWYSFTDTNNLLYNNRLVLNSSEYINNTWNNIILVLTPVDSKVYFNGKYLRSFVSENRNIGANLRIGSRYTDGEGFPGLIDEVRIYNRALSGAEIQAIYNATK
jgi:prepilin-type N-terminal cleavage/methylation domain-containing protein